MRSSIYTKNTFVLHLIYDKSSSLFPKADLILISYLESPQHFALLILEYLTASRVAGFCPLASRRPPGAAPLATLVSLRRALSFCLCVLCTSLVQSPVVSVSVCLSLSYSCILRLTNNREWLKFKLFESFRLVLKIGTDPRRRFLNFPSKSPSRYIHLREGHLGSND